MNMVILPKENAMPKTITYCQVENCETRCHGHGYCLKHYKQITRHGKLFTSIYDPRLAIIEGDIAKLPLGIDAKDGYAIVDKEFAYLDKYKWMLSSGYPKSSGGKRGSPKSLHRYVLGDIPGLDIDHINGDTLDCRTANLRHCVHADNTRNLPLSKSNATGYKGVFFLRSFNKYRATIGYNYRTIYLGLFNTAEEASMAYENKAKELFGEFKREII